MIRLDMPYLALEPLRIPDFPQTLTRLKQEHLNHVLAILQVKDVNVLLLVGGRVEDCGEAADARLVFVVGVEGAGD
jgi:hypothetical protein